MQKRRWKPLLGAIIALAVTIWLLAWGGAFSSPAARVGVPSATGSSVADPGTPGTRSAGQGPVEMPNQPPPAGGDPAAAVPVRGSGAVQVANFVRPAPTGQRGRAVRVRVEVERELALDPETVAREAADVLQDPRSWSSRGEGSFSFVGQGSAELTIRILTPDTTDQRCLPLKTLGEVSCQQTAAVNLNARRWVGAVPDYRGDVAGYRRYLVNHEVGHFLGHQHSDCPGAGRPAPVMMQQTKGLEGCTANSWPLAGRTP